MTDTHVVSALKTKRVQVATHIESLQGQLRQAVIDLDHVEAALRLFDPGVDLAALPPPELMQDSASKSRSLISERRSFLIRGDLRRLAPEIYR